MLSHRSFLPRIARGLRTNPNVGLLGIKLTRNARRADWLDRDSPEVAFIALERSPSRPFAFPATASDNLSVAALQPEGFVDSRRRPGLETSGRRNRCDGPISSGDRLVVEFSGRSGNRGTVDAAADRLLSASCAVPG